MKESFKKHTWGEQLWRSLVRSYRPDC